MTASFESAMIMSAYAIRITNLPRVNAWYGKLLELCQAAISKRGANFLLHSKECEFRSNHRQEDLVSLIREIFKK
jgi:hypothetical protein